MDTLNAGAGDGEGGPGRTAVVLFNLGGPDSPAAIRPFLYNFFIDPNIIRLPFPLRWLVANSIARRRSRREARESYGLLGGASPLLENTRAQAAALEDALNAHAGHHTRVFVCMRYWHPMADEVAAQVRDFAPGRVVLLPLYPQYSTTTTRSSLRTWNKAARRAGLSAPASLVCCYPEEDGFVAASATLVRETVAQAEAGTGRAPRVLFSAHGLPEDIVRDGDPYAEQCRRSAAAIAAAAGIPASRWTLCYQSRVGPKKWLGPSTEAEIRRAAADGVPVVVYPHAFVNEHVETLAEIEIEYRALAAAENVPGFYRVPTVSTHPVFIAGLARLARQAASHPGRIETAAGGAPCPASFRRCCRREEAVV